MKGGIPGTQPAAAAAAAKPFRADRGCYVGERPAVNSYCIDKGAQYLMRSGFEPSTLPIGATAWGEGEAFEGLLDGVGDGLVRQGIDGRYYSVPVEHLWGLSVALLFSTGDHPKCSSFLPFLTQFYKNVNEAGDRPKIEVIYISLDSDRAVFEEGRRHMPWLSLNFDCPLRDKLIKRYRLKVEPSGAAVFPGCVTMGIPRLLVVGPRGEEMHWLSCDHESPTVLKEWDYKGSQWLTHYAPSHQQQQQQQRRQLYQEDVPPAGVPSVGVYRQKEETFGMNPSVGFAWPLTPEAAADWSSGRQQHPARS